MLFGNPQALPLFWLLPLLAVLAVAAFVARKRRTARWGDPELWDRLVPGRAAALRWLRWTAGIAALGLGITAAARPQVGARLVQVERQGIDVVVALDVSLSMEATDVVPNRLDRSRQEIRELFDRLAGDRMAVVLFSGSPFLLCPLTVDVAAGNLFLDAVAADILPAPGTNLEEALKGARDAFGDDDPQGRGRAIILFTDGEGHEGDPLAVAKTLAEEKIPVLTVGVGTPGGEPIPILDDQGRKVGYKKDRAGEVVLSRLDEETLRRIAATTAGEYFAATLQGGEVDRIADYLERLQRGEFGEAFRRRVEERFQIPVGVALVFVALALATPEARRMKRSAQGERA